MKWFQRFLLVMAFAACAHLGTSSTNQTGLRSRTFACTRFDHVEFYYADSGAVRRAESAQRIWGSNHLVWPTEQIPMSATRIVAMRLFEFPMIRLGPMDWVQPAESRWGDVDLDRPNVVRRLGLDLDLPADDAATLHRALAKVHREYQADPLLARQIAILIGGVVVAQVSQQRPLPEQPSRRWRVALGAELEFSQALQEIEGLLSCES